MSASVIARRIIATPERHASEAWSVMVKLLAPDTGSDAHKELSSVAGIVASLISDEAFKNAPAVMRGKGPRIRLYCLHDEEAISGDNASEAALATVPTEDDWKLSLPCPIDDLSWVQAALKQKSTRITARDLSEPVTDDEEESKSDSASNSIAINREAFFRK